MTKLVTLLVGLCLNIALNTALAFAETPVPSGSTVAPAGAPTAPPNALGSMVVPLLAMFAVMYFLVFRPQQKRVKEQQQMLSQIQYGDEIVTSSGILGKITGIAEKVVTVEVSDKVHFKMLKSQIAQVVKGQIKEISPN
jgi:preprotein translocase subunit YajC